MIPTPPPAVSAEQDQFSKLEASMIETAASIARAADMVEKLVAEYDNGAEPPVECEAKLADAFRGVVDAFHVSLKASHAYRAICETLIQEAKGGDCKVPLSI